MKKRKNDPSLHKRAPSPVRDRIFRAMYASTFFTSREIAILSGAKIGLIKKLIWIHRKAGEIEITATRGHRHGGRQHIYRLTNPDEFYLKWLGPVKK